MKSIKVAAVVIVALAFATGASAGNYCKPKKPTVPVVTIVPTVVASTGPEICKNGKRPVAGTDGHVPASGNTNDKCDWSAPARVPHPQYPNG